MKWIISEEAAKKRKNKDKKKLKKYWRLVYPPDYADELVGNKNDCKKVEN